MKYTNSLLAVAALLAAGLACGDRAASNGNVTVGNTNSNAAAPGKNDPGQPKNIAGEYDATGTNVDNGGTYKASLVVTPRDDVYQFSWNSAGRVYDGVGVMTDNAVAVSYTEGSDGKGCGVVLYKIGADGSLEGKSGYWGVNTAESEKATRTSGTELPGKYDITGKNTGGKEYKGTLEVTSEGEGYVFKWNAGTSFEGFGTKTGNKVAVGFGGKQCAFVSYFVENDGTLTGKWGSQGSRAFGREVAKKKTK